MRIYLQEEVASHSRRVAFLRVCLPATALALVAVLVLMPSEDLLEDGARSSKTGGAHLQYSGKMAEGSVVEVTLANFLEEENLSVVQGVVASILHLDGTRHDVEAATLKASSDRDLIDLEGGAVLNSVGEFLVESESFRISLHDSSLLSGGKVEFSFPGGTGNAGKMRITSRPVGSGDGGGWSFIEFIDGVEVTFIRPKNSDL